jgi:RNA polymerase sigma-70 factor, ECF subfamily
MRRLAAIPDDPPSVGDLYELEGPRLWRAVFAWCQDRAVTDDSVAEAFAQCLRRGADVRDPGAWVWTAAFRLAAGELKARRRFVPDHDAGDPPVEAPTADAVELLAALRRLPPNQRAAVVLRYYGGWKTDEIARALGTGRATVRVHLSRGRRRLRELLQGEDT